MRLAISNLAIPLDADVRIIAGLCDIGLTGIEVAPTRIAPWEELSDTVIASYAAKLRGLGLEICSMQALLFGKPNCRLLADEASFILMEDHLRRVSKMAQILGARVGVFGSPKNRSRGALSAEIAWDLGRRRFARLAKIADCEGFVLGLEPVPLAYGGDFLTSWSEVGSMVAEVNEPGLRIHLDTGCVLLGGGSIGQAVEAAGPLLAHFHIAEPSLSSFAVPQSEHAEAAAALGKIGYSDWLAIEMLEQANDPFGAIKQAITFARDFYLNEAAP